MENCLKMIQLIRRITYKIIQRSTVQQILAEKNQVETLILKGLYCVNHPSVIDYNMHRTVLEPIIGFSDTLCVQGRTNLRNLRKSQFVAHTICRPNIKHDKCGGSIFNGLLL